MEDRRAWVDERQLFRRGSTTQLTRIATIRSSPAQRLFHGLTGTGWRARAHEVDPTTAQWKVTAFAICSNINGALTTATYVGPKEDAIQSPVTQPGPPRSGTQSWVAPCPSGTKVIGGGGMVLGATDATPPPADVVLGASHPEDAPTATGWSVQAHDTDPPGPAYRVAIRAICG